MIPVPPNTLAPEDSREAQARWYLVFRHPLIRLGRWLTNDELAHLVTDRSVSSCVGNTRPDLLESQYL